MGDRARGPAGASRYGPPHVVILGAGYAGFAVARGLGAAPARVTLVNPYSYHYFTTLLHEPVARPRQRERVALPLAPYLPPNVRLWLGRATAIDPRRRVVEVEDRATGARRRLQADLLVVAVGSEPLFFGIAGLEERALTVRDLSSGPLIRSTVEHHLARYAAGEMGPEGRRIVIGGGGYTGVELAAELAEVRHDLARATGVAPGAIEIYLVEAAPTLLPGFDPPLVRYVTRFLERVGVRVITGTPIAEVTPRHVILADGRRLEAGTVIWTGGVRAHRLVEQAGFEVDKRGRALVERDLAARGCEGVYLAGDAAAFPGDDGRPLPPTAQVALQQGEYLARALTRRLRGQPVEPFRPHLLGTVISLGRRDGVGLLRNGYRVTGRAARVLKSATLWRYLYRIGGVPLVARVMGGASLQPLP
ncbi:FAD-dependent pyridine nucleotide-disulfide oxidoreductase [Thermaerobacter marianensis DSM 12885]|uniref:FAD-dependent pyridine nucleotide-disulfide oxidoreductase n=1 Tax=Thermaerobacter marianensis (strain ATCC 700841 / DSM 12885 / JCM 10246 / 7p75a) TaxID=644966 RepID=E6SJG0_THEM7|nr:NAD(P)/FAD-dependent oxidoreductase [Thermaerobacter marianensis]ADU52115.1 FAD-dependent pyridine nucleotide-disulfide oxidoreductase [Thermaerobacter marianensis DSM 12885]